jgi:hypothetical protein
MGAALEAGHALLHPLNAYERAKRKIQEALQRRRERKAREKKEQQDATDAANREKYQLMVDQETARLKRMMQDEKGQPWDRFNRR